MINVFSGLKITLLLLKQIEYKIGKQVPNIIWVLPLFVGKDIIFLAVQQLPRNLYKHFFMFERYYIINFSFLLLERSIRM